ncbi:DUF1513 domain-containing protein [Lentibacter algarum]|uniref:DUF1513 domain-containing protein n=1 Tax=Lentibacter algarum TaxID=576131 RepID=UPI001C0847B9|nr:DUF1513 domain-containing protein [Lentibacter algarum]MBU2983366.1 DUF1513 domain-containing protein [Lentibacter algarum]
MTAQNTGRRRFLGGLLAAGVFPKPTWADVGAPAFLSAAAKPDGSSVLCGVGANLQVLFELPLPARGHAAAAHPTRPEAVAFARRPGTFAVVIDCTTGTQRATLCAPHGRHFYGHGAFSSDGSLLFTTENDYEAGQGRIGVWDTLQGYKRIDEWASGGVGPHDVKRLPNSETLVVANGGIETHPDSGRTKLNIATMAPNLAYIAGGAVVERVQLAAELHRNSIRHLAVGVGGQVAFGMQWQGSGPLKTLVGVHLQGAEVQLLEAPTQALRAMQGYVGSIAFTPDAKAIAVTSPRGGVVQLYDAKMQGQLETFAMPDVCGIAAVGETLTVSSGNGEMRHLLGSTRLLRRLTELRWDNHLVPVA